MPAVMIGVRVGGRKELIAMAGGYREPAGSRAGLLRGCARRGMRAPVLAAGDGTVGFWDALREVFPRTRQGRCWFRKIANVLAALPKSQARWPCANAYLAALVRAAAVFRGGVLTGRPGQAAA